MSFEVPSASRTRRLEPGEIHPVARTLSEWEQTLSPLGEPAFRAKQVFRWIHERGVLDAADMTDLKLALRERLADQGLRAPFVVERALRAADGTRKLLLRLPDGGLVECVLIPMSREAEATDADVGALDDGDDLPGEPSSQPAQRVTLCVSTQHGCAMGCRFCASGRAGLLRGLGAAEIVAQAIVAKRYLDPGESLRNVVFMGMGEPLHHYDETARAIRLLTEPLGLGIGLRRITVSTVGLVPGIERLGRDFDGKLGLAVSLHAPNDALRDRIMPINTRYPVSELIGALRRYPLPKRRRITIEYTLIAGLNDAPDHATELADQLRGLRVKVNLIPVNPVQGVGYQPPSAGAVERFRQRLVSLGLACSTRKRRGDEVDAACGQLALVELGRGPVAPGPA